MRLGLCLELYLDCIRGNFCTLLFFPCERRWSRIFGMSLFHHQFADFVSDSYVDFWDRFCIVGFRDYCSTSSSPLYACYLAPCQPCKDVSFLHEDLAFYIFIFACLKYHRKTRNCTRHDSARLIHYYYFVDLYCANIVHGKGCVPCIFVSICESPQDVAETNSTRVNMLLVKKFAPGASSLGSTTGLIQFCICFSRAFSPSFARYVISINARILDI